MTLKETLNVRNRRFLNTSQTEGLLRETKAKNLQRLRDLKKYSEVSVLSPEEWQEYHMLKHKYQSRRLKQKGEVKTSSNLAEQVEVSDKQVQRGSARRTSQNPAPAKDVYKSAIKECLRKGKPQDMSVADWREYQKWAEEKLKELGENPAPAKDYVKIVREIRKAVAEGKLDLSKYEDMSNEFQNPAPAKSVRGADSRTDKEWKDMHCPCPIADAYEQGIAHGKSDLYDYYFKGFENPIIIEKSDADTIKEVIEILKEGKDKDAWGNDCITGDWNGLMKKLKDLETRK
jgi:hypothetical protein